MSLVGTRPPTVDEWEQYELHHRSRMSTKPGITGMWQVSGRSDITDFEEVVKLDTEYIENWSISINSSFVPYLYESMKKKKYKEIGKIALEIEIIVGLLCFGFSLFAPEVIATD